MQKIRAKEILRILRDNFIIPSWAGTNRYPFRTLILTVLSQASQKKLGSSLQKSLKKFPITSETLSRAEIEDIEETMKVGGSTETKPESLKPSPK